MKWIYYTLLLSFPLFLSSIFPDSVYFLFHFLLFPLLSLPLSFFSLVTASRHTAVPLPATSIKLPAPPAAADSRYARTWAYRHSHACIHVHNTHTRARARAIARTHIHIHKRTQTRHVSASGRHTDGYGCHGSSAVLHSPSSPFSPSPLLPAPARTPLDSLFFSFPLAPARHLLSGMSVVRWRGRERQERQRKRSEQPHELRHRIPHALYTRCPKYHGFSLGYRFLRKIVAILLEGWIWLNLEFIFCSHKVYLNSYKFFFLKFSFHLNFDCSCLHTKVYIHIHYS